MWACACEQRSLQNSEEGVNPPAAGIKGGCEPPDMELSVELRKKSTDSTSEFSSYSHPLL